MNIRAQLLLVGLSTLVLPWAGCQYARELEVTLRASQEQALLASAGTIANALSAQPQRVFRGEPDGEAFDPGQGDLYAFPLRRMPLLDGYRSDWGIAAAPRSIPKTDGAAAGSRPLRLMAGVTDRYLYLYAEVDDPHFEPEPSDVRPGDERYDRVALWIERPDGELDSVFFATGGQGLIAAQRLVRGEGGTQHVHAEPRIQAYWLQTAAGYHLEARVPLELVGPRLRIAAFDGDAANPSDGVAVADESLRGHRLFFATPGLDEWLATFVRTGTEATVIDANHLKFGVAGNFDANIGETGSPQLTRAWFRGLMAADNADLPEHGSPPDRLEGPQIALALDGRPAASWLRTGSSAAALLSAAAPIVTDGLVRGAVVLEQPGDELIGLRDRALARLFNLTLIATAVAVLCLSGFATWIGVRIGRLRAAADSAIGTDGHIRLAMPESGRSDEIGALARSFESLLARLKEHTQYLRTLGGKLSHELRTPLTIVRSSLDNLESVGLRDDQRIFVHRAREGSSRLASILNALGAAARVEESIKQAERHPVDLCELLSAAVAGYQSAFRESHIELTKPPDPCFLNAAPDLLVQLLDKLIDNAVDFCPAGGGIAVALERDSGRYRLSVANDGPPIPEAMLGRLFESLFEQRASRDAKPHFGLGLYIVRLIAEFHGGTVCAANRDDARGAVFTVTLPII